ncbi:MAG: laccase domain-containing protein [Arcicella sp.]|nr:laccase domain-containing protein [Arcicella sp.]
MAETFAYEFKTLVKNGRKVKFFVDLKKANAAQLMKCGVPENQIEISKFSTVLDNQDYFSHRKRERENRTNDGVDWGEEIVT